MDTYVVNFYPIAKFIICLFAVVGFFTFLNNLLHTFTFGKLLDKYPDVTNIFARLSLREQNIENNQEIHDLEKRVRKLEGKHNG